MRDKVVGTCCNCEEKTLDGSILNEWFCLLAPVEV